MFQLRIRVDGEEQLARGFEISERHADDLSAPLRDAAEILRQSIGQNFASEGGNVGGWAPLSPDYREWKESHFPGMPILVRTRAMRAAILSESAFTVEKRRMVYDPDAPAYAIFHQRGTSRMPQRKVVQITKDDARQIDRAFARWLAYVTRSLGGSLRPGGFGGE